MFVSDVLDASWPVGKGARRASQQASAREVMDALLGDDELDADDEEVPEQEPTEQRRATPSTKLATKKTKKTDGRPRKAVTIGVGGSRQKATVVVSDDDEETIGEGMKRRAAATEQQAKEAQVPRFQRTNPGETLEGGGRGQQSRMERGGASKPRQFRSRRRQGDV